MNKTSFYTSQKGFTLIELLVVISIIGLLSSVVLSSLNSAKVKSKSSVYKSELVTLRPSLISACDSATLTATDAPATASHAAGTIGTQSCGSNGTGSFTVTFGAALNGGACTAATITHTALSFAGC